MTNEDFYKQLDDLVSRVNILERYGGASSAYPVGSIYISTESTDPSTIFGGTWTAFGAGKTLVGLDSGDTDFDTVEETGGSKTHTLSIDEIPSHAHNLNGTKALAAGTAYEWYDNSDGATKYPTGSKGSGDAHNNLQPYIVTYMFKRTA
jgi:microcystin-dependent protein